MSERNLFRRIKEEYLKTSPKHGLKTTGFIDVPATNDDITINPDSLTWETTEDKTAHEPSTLAKDSQVESLDNEQKPKNKNRKIRHIFVKEVNNMTERRTERNTHTKEKKTKDWLKKGTATALVGVGVGAAALGIGFGIKEAKSNDEVKPATGITQTIATPTTNEASAGPGNNPEVTATTIAEMTSTTEKVNTEPTNSTTSTTESTESAVKNADGWSLKNPDGQEVSINLPEGFTPDKNLVIQSDLQMNEINKDLSKYQDWDKVVHEVAGYNYDENDFSGNADFKENVQGDMWAWRVFQGDRVEVPGIGLLEGDERTSVVVLFLNLQPKVIDWDNEGYGQTYTRHGFTATGRIWDAGSPEKIAKTEELLSGHWLFRQKEGTPEKSYIGVTDDPDNAKKTLFVSAAYRQWGNNEDGTPREQFQLLRAELVDFNK